MDWDIIHVNCLLFARNSKCAHPDYRGFFGPGPCVYSDRRCTGCKIQVKISRPDPPVKRTAYEETV